MKNTWNKLTALGELTDTDAALSREALAGLDQQMELLALLQLVRAGGTIKGALEIAARLENLADQIRRTAVSRHEGDKRAAAGQIQKAWVLSQWGKSPKPKSKRQFTISASEKLAVSIPEDGIAPYKVSAEQIEKRWLPKRSKP